MSKVSSGGNPYDFRSPVRRRELLAGRADELAQIDEYLRAADSGRPAHVSLFGKADSGKSSLLNGVVDIARERGFLAVKLTLREAMVDTELDFYRAVWDAALQALIEVDWLDPTDARMMAWTRMTGTGELDTDAPGSLELGPVVAAKLLGRMVSQVSTPLLKRDIQRLISFGSEHACGLVLCLDNAELLDRNRDLAPSLIQLADATPLLTIVTAAEAAGSLQKKAPRAWAQIEVCPFKHPAEVLTAIAKPINHRSDTLGSKAPTPETAVDIYHLTNGEPYEINLVCHFIWDAIMQGEQDAFELSPRVIEQVIRELEEKGRHEASPEIAKFSSLSASELRSLVEVAPYESLTTRQMALIRLMLEDYDERDLEAAQGAVCDQLEQLERHELVRTERDRFRLVGGRDARLYLRYVARRETAHELGYGQSYPHALTKRCASELRRVLVGDGSDDFCLFSAGRPHEVGGSVAGRWIDNAVKAATGNNIVALGDAFGRWIPPADLLEHPDKTFLLVALRLQVGVHDVEHLELVVNAQSHDVDAARSGAIRWTDENRQLLSKYEARGLDVRCEVIDYDVLAASQAYELLRLGRALTYILYSGGGHEAAEELLAALLETSTKLAGENPADPLLRTTLADALHREGFMAAAKREWGQALARFDASATMSLTETWLLDYNQAFVRASQGRLGDAISFAESALNRYDSDCETVLLHAFLPTPADWVPPRNGWNTVELHGHWIRRFLKLQLHVLRATEAGQASEELKAALEDLGGSAPAPLLRLAGWAQLTFLNRAPDAAALFRRAAGASSYDETEIPEAEEAFAESKIVRAAGKTRVKRPGGARILRQIPADAADDDAADRSSAGT